MKNTLYDLNDLFQATRRYYMKTFPYAGSGVSAEIMNLELKRNSSTMHIAVADQFGNTTFEGAKIAQRTDSVYAQPFGVTLEDYLSDKTCRKDVMDDLKELKGWMIKEEFLSVEKVGLLATGKLLKVNKLTP